MSSEYPAYLDHEINKIISQGFTLEDAIQSLNLDAVIADKVRKGFKVQAQAEDPFSLLEQTKVERIRTLLNISRDSESDLARVSAIKALNDMQGTDIKNASSELGTILERMKKIREGPPRIIEPKELDLENNIKVA